MISLGAIARLSGSTWGGHFTSLRQLYRWVVIPQISYACSLWYIPMDEKGHRKSYVQMLQSVQTKVARIITEAFKVTSLPALDVEGYLLLLHLQLEKSADDAVLRLATNSSFKTLFQVEPRRKTHKASPLEVLIVRFGKQWGVKVENIEPILPYVTPPWWCPPKTCIQSNKQQAKN